MSPSPAEPQSKTNLRLVQDAFAAFAARDVKAVLAMLADDIAWHGARSPDIPYGGFRQGKAEVEKFFARLGQSIEYESFEAMEYVVHNERVVVIGREKFLVKKTGKHVVNEWAMFFTLREGKIARFQVYEDTAAVVAGFRAD